MTPEPGSGGEVFMREFKLLIGQVTRLEADVVEARKLAERAEWALQSMLMKNCPERPA